MWIGAKLQVVRVREQKRTAIRFALMAAIKEHEEKLNTERTLIKSATTMPIVGLDYAFEFVDLRIGRRGR